MTTTRARLRYFAGRLVVIVPLLLSGAAGATIAGHIAPTPLLWGLGGFLGGFLGVICGLAGLWVLQPVIEGRE